MHIVVALRLVRPDCAKEWSMWGFANTLSSVSFLSCVNKQICRRCSPRGCPYGACFLYPFLSAPSAGTFLRELRVLWRRWRMMHVYAVLSDLTSTRFDCFPHIDTRHSSASSHRLTHKLLLLRRLYPPSPRAPLPTLPAFCVSLCLVISRRTFRVTAYRARRWRSDLRRYSCGR